MIGCSGRRVPPEDAELDLVGPGLEEVEGDLGAVHHRDLPLVDHQDVVPGPEAALPRGAGLHHAAKWGSELVLCKRLIGEVVQSPRRPLLGSSPG